MVKETNIKAKLRKMLPNLNLLALYYIERFYISVRLSLTFLWAVLVEVKDLKVGPCW